MKNSTILCSFLLVCSIFSYASENADENTRINAAPELHALTPSKDFEINLQATIAEQERALAKKDKEIEKRDAELEKHRPTLEKTALLWTIRVLSYGITFTIGFALGVKTVMDSFERRQAYSKMLDNGIKEARPFCDNNPKITMQ